MTYPLLLLSFGIPFVILSFILSSVMGRRVLPLDRASLLAIFLSYVVWVLADAIAISHGIWSYSKAKIWNIWFLGMPLEDHIAGLGAPMFAILAYKLFKAR